MCLRYESRHSHLKDAVQSPVSPSVNVTLRVTGDDCKVARAAEWPIRHVLFRVPLGYFSIFFCANMDQLNSEPQSSYKGFTTKNCYYFLFSDQVSLSCPNWPWTHSVSWAALKLVTFLLQPPELLGEQTSATNPIHTVTLLWSECHWNPLGQSSSVIRMLVICFTGYCLFSKFIHLFKGCFKLAFFFFFKSSMVSPMEVLTPLLWKGTHIPLCSMWSKALPWSSSVAAGPPPED